MNMEHINQRLTLLANLAVFAGIVFLGLEIRQNSDLMKIQIQQSRADAATASLGEEYNSPYIPGIRVKIDIGEALTPDEEYRYRGWFRAVNRVQDNVLYQYNSGMLTENSPISVQNFIEGVVASSAHSRKTWNEIKTGFTEEYVGLVESVLVRAQ